MRKQLARFDLAASKLGPRGGLAAAQPAAFQGFETPATGPSFVPW